MGEDANSRETDEAALILRKVFSDPCFAVPAADGLNYSTAEQSAPLFSHLSYAVTQQPDNLHAHLRRIRLAAALGSPEMAAEAVTDLFIVLGDKGGDLRVRILKSNKNLLPGSCYARLVHAFPAGIDAHVPLPNRSRLTKGNAGRDGFIVPDQKAKTRETAALEDDDQAFLETVRDLLDSGHLAEACSLLEDKLPEAEEPLWKEGVLELARLYRYMEGGETRARTWWAVLWRRRKDRAQAWARLLTQGTEQ